MKAKTYSDKEIMEKLGIDSKTLALFKAVREKGIEEAKRMGAVNRTKLKVLGVSGSARDEMDMAQEASNSEELLKRCLAACERAGAETELIPLRKYSIEHCKACYSTANTQCHFYCSCYPKGGKNGDDMSNVLYDKVLGADAIVFATPVNNFKISTLMSAFIDRCISLDGSLSPADPKNPKNKELNIKHMKYIELTADNAVPGSGMLRRFAGKVAGIIATGHEEGASMAISSLYMTLTHYGMLFPPFSNMYAMSSVCRSTYEDKGIVLSDCYDVEIECLAQNVLLAAGLLKKCKPTDWKNDYHSN
jgi:multimeric flavodoxin WrbA